MEDSRGRFDRCRGGIFEAVCSVEVQRNRSLRCLRTRDQWRGIGLPRLGTVVALEVHNGLVTG